MTNATLNDFIQLTRSRRAIRRFTDEPIPPELLDLLLETAVWSPSAHNRQPWRFAVLEDAASKETLARAMGQRLRADRTADGDSPDAIERDVARSFARITGAAALIVVCLSMADMDSYPDPTAEKGDWSVVDLAPFRKLNKTVTLKAVKATPELQNIGLVRNPRLSVMPLEEAEFQKILEMGETDISFSRSSVRKNYISKSNSMRLSLRVW